MRYILFFIVLFSARSASFAGCFYAENGVLCIDSLVKRWKYYDKEEIIDSLKNIGVEFNVSKPYKQGYGTVVDITIHKAYVFSRQFYSVSDLVIRWGDFNQKGKVVQYKSDFSFTIANKEENLKSVRSNIYPFYWISIPIGLRYGHPNNQSHQYPNQLGGNDYLKDLLKRIRTQDTDKVKKESVYESWFGKSEEDTNRYYNVRIESNYQYLLKFYSSWSRSL